MNRVADTLEMMRQQDESIARSMDVQLAEGGFGVITANAHNGEDILYTCGLSWKQCPELIMAGREHTWAVKWVGDYLAVGVLPAPRKPVILHHPDLDGDLWLAPLQSRLAGSLPRVTGLLRSRDYPGQPIPLLGLLLTQRGHKPRNWFTKLWSDAVPSRPETITMPRPRDTPDPAQWGETSEYRPPTQIPARLMIAHDDEQGLSARQISDHLQRMIARLQRNKGDDITVLHADGHLSYAHGAIRLILNRDGSEFTLPAQISSAGRTFGLVPTDPSASDLSAVAHACRAVLGHWPVSSDHQILDLCDDAGLTLSAVGGGQWTLIGNEPPPLQPGEWNPAADLSARPPPTPDHAPLSEETT